METNSTNNTNKPNTAETIVKAVIGDSVKTAKFNLVITIVVIVAVACAVALFTFNPFGWKLGWSFDNSLKIEDTANIVEKVRKISEFTTSCYYEEYVIKSEKNEVQETKNLFGISSEKNIHHEVVITVKGSVRAGFNLSKLSENDFVVHGDSIDVKIPAPEIFDVISNPSDYTIFAEEGKWSHEEIVALQSNAKTRTLNNAIQSGVLAKANTNGKEHIINLFKAFGFNVVNVILEEIPAVEQFEEEQSVTEHSVADTSTALTNDSLVEPVVNAIEN